jgi:short-subunit dehydrogenase
MNFTDKVVILTGANGGLGKELLQKILHKGAAKIYATARDTAKLDFCDDERVVKVQLDLNDDDSILNAVETVEGFDILINNAGVNSATSIFENDWIDFDVNVRGTINFTKPLMQKIERGGAIVNVTSILALLNLPAMARYSASKSALHSLTQALRAKMASKDVKVFEVLPGPIDTNMTEGQDMDKTKPDVIADAIIEGLDKNILEIYPDAFAKSIVEGLRMNPKGMEEEFASYL